MYTLQALNIVNIAMSQHRLPHYVRSQRKLKGLTQSDITFLLGAKGGAKVCRLEKFVRQPDVFTVFACECIFGKPASVLFAGLFEEIREVVSARASSLFALKRSRKGPPLSGKRAAAIRQISKLSGDNQKSHI